ncbi:hypothetical protein ACS0TY_025845 [Phlomoides rotata]
MVGMVGCEVRRISISYLGMNTRINHHNVSAWGDLIHKIKKSLAAWNIKHILMGGRLTLIQVSLSSVLIYYLSFYLLSNITLREIKTVQ